MASATAQLSESEDKLRKVIWWLYGSSVGWSNPSRRSRRHGKKPANAKFAWAPLLDHSRRLHQPLLAPLASNVIMTAFLNAGIRSVGHVFEVGFRLDLKHALHPIFSSPSIPPSRTIYMRCRRIRPSWTVLWRVYNVSEPTRKPCSTMTARIVESSSKGLQSTQRERGQCFQRLRQRSRIDQRSRDQIHWCIMTMAWTPILDCLMVFFYLDRMTRLNIFIPSRLATEFLNIGARGLYIESRYIYFSPPPTLI